MIYLFSSTLQELYIQNILQTLALPYGAIVHFRYREKWVTPEFLSHAKTYLSNSNNALENETELETLVVLCKMPSKPELQLDENMQFFPLRQGIIRHVEVDGLIIHVYLELGNYVEWPQMSDQIAQRDSVSENFDLGLKKLLNRDTLRPPGKLLAVANGTTQDPHQFASTHNASQAWQKIADYLGNTPEFSRTIFYRVSGMYEAHYSLPSQILRAIHPKKDIMPTLSLVPLRQLLPNRTGYILVSGRIYQLGLTFYHADYGSNDNAVYKTKNKIVPTVDPTYYRNLPNPIEVAFRYDQQSILLVSSPIFEESWTTISLIPQIAPSSGQASNSNGPEQSINKSLPDMTQPIRAPEIRIMLKLTYPRISFYIGFFVLLIAQLLTALGSDRSLAPELARTFAITGAATTSIIIFLLLRRLPGIK